jgi:hypothetical protein
MTWRPLLALRSRAQHDDEIGHLAGLVESDQVHAEQSILTNTGAEFEGVAVFAAKGPMVVKICENAKHQSKNSNECILPPVRLELCRIVIGHVVDQQSGELVPISLRHDAVPLLQASLRCWMRRACAKV